jgi:hypothetical protein
MKLREKFEPYVIRYTQDDVVGYLPEEVPILEYQEECEKIADEYAIEFAKWFWYHGRKYWRGERTDYLDMSEILEIYKKEKGL